jgi:hypothetical protein
MSHMFSHSVVKISSIVACASMLAACKPPAKGVPSGYIGLAYEGMSGSSIDFELENNSTQAIYFRGANNGLTGAVPWPGAATMECRETASLPWVGDGVKMADGWPAAVEVAPGERRRMTVESALPQQHKGGRCRLRLELLGGTFVESKDFTP